jgi:hypothetical protein
LRRHIPINGDDHTEGAVDTAKKSAVLSSGPSFLLHGSNNMTRKEAAKAPWQTFV